MASKNTQSISKYDVLKTQINEFKQMKMDLEQLKNELTAAQIKYHQRLSDYEAKVEQLHCQAEKVYQEQTDKETNLSNATAEWHDIKKRLESNVLSPSERVKLNVGGIYFETTIETLTKQTEDGTTYFKALFSGLWQVKRDPKDESIFIDRDGKYFDCILNYLRTSKLFIDDTDLIFRRKLIVEAEFYNIRSLVSLLTMNDTKLQKSISEQREFYSDTKILSVQCQEQLNKLYGNNEQRWKLIYRASQHGFTADQFHKHCDNYGPTITVIRSVTGFIFGGFTAIPWTSIHQDKYDIKAFLFTLKNPHGIKPTKYPIEGRSASFAVSHRKINGPTFGSINNGGSDIYVHCPFNTDGSRIHFPRSYTDITRKGRTTFTDNPHFSCRDVEVFLLISE